MRDGDGLALSSRNALSVATMNARGRWRFRGRWRGARDAIVDGAAVATALAEARAALETAGFGPIDYVALVDAATLEPLDAASGRHAADRRGDDRHDPADRQCPCRCGHSIAFKVIVALTICSVFAAESRPRSKQQGY